MCFDRRIKCTLGETCGFLCRKMREAESAVFSRPGTHVASEVVNGPSFVGLRSLVSVSFYHGVLHCSSADVLTNPVRSFEVPERSQSQSGRKKQARPFDGNAPQKESPPINVAHPPKCKNGQTVSWVKMIVRTRPASRARDIPSVSRTSFKSVALCLWTSSNASSKPATDCNSNCNIYCITITKTYIDPS